MIASERAEFGTTRRLVQTQISGTRSSEGTAIDDVFAAVGRTEQPVLEEIALDRVIVDGIQDYRSMLHQICSPREVCGEEGHDVRHQLRLRRTGQSGVQRKP